MASVITDKEKLNAGMSATADAIREKTGESAPIPWDYEGETGFAAAVAAIPAGREPVIEPKTITENGIYTVPAGVDGYGPIIVGVAVRSPRCDQVVTFDWGAEQQYMAWMDGTPEPEPGPEPEPDPPTPGDTSWANASDATIAALLDAAAAGTIDLQQDAGWAVGDVRTIHVDSWTGGSSVTHAAEDLTIAISSFDEYMGCGNVMQFDFVECASGKQCMNATATNEGGYGETEMYTVTLPAMADALPGWLKSRLISFSVQVYDVASDPASLETVAGNRLALRSSKEVYGEGGRLEEGKWVDYYKNSSAARIKTEGTSGNAVSWWLRSPVFQDSFVDATFLGTSGIGKANNFYGLAPFGCL